MNGNSCQRHRPVGGFSLLEVILALFILSLLSLAVVPSVRDTIETRQRDTESRALEELAATVTASFQSTDLATLNVAALAGTIGATDSPTVFSTSVAAPTTTDTNAWFAKVARLRSITPTVGVSPALQPALSSLVFNALGQTRFLFAAPAETDRQRFVLVSLAAPSGALVLPAYESTAAWFDAIWSNDWESRTAAPPTLWQSKLTAAQYNAWLTGRGGLTQVARLRVQRITLPKYRVTVNANHPTDKGFVSYNNTAPALTVNAGSGANTTPSLLAGRAITINRGTAYPGAEVLRFTLKENATVTLQ